MNHFARDCYKRKRKEATGRSGGNGGSRNLSRTAALTADLINDIPDEELEQLLAQRRLQREQVMLEDDVSTVGTVTTSGQADAVGPTLYFNMTVGGIPVKTMVDCGSQSTIISRSLLHRVWRHLKQQGEPLHELELPDLKLFGKDGHVYHSQKSAVVSTGI